MSMGERIRLVRGSLSQAEFAGRLGIHQKTVAKYESERHGIGSSVLEAICRAFPDVNPAWLLTGEGEMLKGASADKPLSRAPQLDEELHGRVVEGVMTVYKEEGAGLPPRHLGQLAAQIHGELIAAYTDPAERQIGLKLRLEQLRRELRSTDAGATSSKRLA